MAFPQEYKLLRRLGDGAHASAFKVRHKKLGYIRALKVLNAFIIDENDRPYQSFLKECSLLLRIGNGCHPNIVRLYQPRLLDNKATVEMDYIDGETLAQYLRRREGFIEFDEICKFINQIVDAVAFIHHDIYRFQMSASEDELTPSPDDANKFLITPEKERQLIDKYSVMHNDLHSENIMRREYDGAFILLDFGLAIQNGKAVKSSSITDGAIEYRAPEKWGDGELNKASDVYSLGVLLYELLAGRVPFPATGPEMDSLSIEQRVARISQAHLKEKPAEIWPLREQAFNRTHPEEIFVGDYPPELEAIIMKALAKDSAERYPDARAMLDEIRKVLQTLERDKKPTAEKITDAIHQNEQIKSLLRTNAELAEQNKNLNEKISQFSHERNGLESRIYELDSQVRELENHLREKNRNSNGGKNRILGFLSFITGCLMIGTLAYLILFVCNLRVFGSNFHVIRAASIIFVSITFVINAWILRRPKLSIAAYFAIGFIYAGMLTALVLFGIQSVPVLGTAAALTAAISYISLCVSKSR